MIGRHWQHILPQGFIACKCGVAPPYSARTRIVWILPSSRTSSGASDRPSPHHGRHRGSFIGSLRARFCSFLFSLFSDSSSDSLPVPQPNQPAPEIVMPTIGTVKFFNATKGFGFIQPEGQSKDVFVHISAVERAGMTTLSENQRVSFELERGPDGRSSAVNLQAA
jgi:CspA family cold shock protein